MIFDENGFLTLTDLLYVKRSNFLLASRLATENLDDEVGCRDHRALLIDEMMITNGIVYPVSQQKVFGLSDIKLHEVKSEIYQGI